MAPLGVFFNTGKFNLSNSKARNCFVEFILKFVSEILKIFFSISSKLFFQILLRFFKNAVSIKTPALSVSIST